MRSAILVVLALAGCTLEASELAGDKKDDPTYVEMCQLDLAEVDVTQETCEAAATSCPYTITGTLHVDPELTASFTPEIRVHPEPTFHAVESAGRMDESGFVAYEFEWKGELNRDLNALSIYLGVSGATGSLQRHAPIDAFSDGGWQINHLAVCKAPKSYAVRLEVMRGAERPRRIEPGVVTEFAEVPPELTEVDPTALMLTVLRQPEEALTIDVFYRTPAGPVSTIHLEGTEMWSLGPSGIFAFEHYVQYVLPTAQLELACGDVIEISFTVTGTHEYSFPEDGNYTLKRVCS